MKKFVLIFVFSFLVLGCSSSQKEIFPIGTFDASIKIFNDSYKAALFSSGKNQALDTESSLVQTLILWTNIENAFLKNQPIEYQKTKDWDKVLDSIGDAISEAEDLRQKGDLLGAHKKLESVRYKLKKIREENNRENLSDKSLIFHDTMEDLLENPSHKNLIQQLQKEIQPLLVYQSKDGKYQKTIQALKKIVDNLKTTEGKEYETNLKKLKPAFIQFYLRFG